MTKSKAIEYLENKAEEAAAMVSKHRLSNQNLAQKESGKLEAYNDALQLLSTLKVK